MKKTTRFCALILVFSLLLSMGAFATESPNLQTDIGQDTASYYDETIDATVTLDVVERDDGVLTMDVYEDNQFAHTLHVDSNQEIVEFIYTDGTVETCEMSDIVTITDVPDIDSVEVVPDNDLVNSDIAPYATDYVANETLSVSTSGVQSTIAGTSYSGYKAMGYRGGYSYAPSTYGYLQRKNSGVSSTSYAKDFSFSKGTALSTAVGIILDTVKGGLTSAIASVMISSLGIVVDYAYSVSYQVNTYKWSYRVRLNSNTGTTIYTNYRTKDYFKMYSSTTGEAYYKYRGSAYDGGFSQANTTMIKTAIDQYLAS